MLDYMNRKKIEEEEDIEEKESENTKKETLIKT